VIASCSFIFSTSGFHGWRMIIAKCRRENPAGTE
jgi:hypothetical protein